MAAREFPSTRLKMNHKKKKKKKDLFFFFPWTWTWQSFEYSSHRDSPHHYRAGSNSQLKFIIAVADMVMSVCVCV